MPYSQFQIYYSGTWRTPSTAAMPVSIGSYRIDLAPIVKYSLPLGRSAAGFPIQVDDEMWAEVGRPKINSSGLSWWFGLSGANLEANAYNQRYVVLWNPITQLWTSYLGYIWRPDWVAGHAGYQIADFKVRITNLTPSEP